MQITANTRSFIEAEQYSAFILQNLHDGLLGKSFYRTISDFSNGDTLHIKTIGTVTLQEAAEDSPLTYNPIESGSITFRLTEYVGDAWYVTDDLREDGSQIEALMAQRSVESTRAFQEKFETDAFKTASEVYSSADPYNVNGFPHKIVSDATNNIFQLSDLIAMRLAFNKANVPAAGRILVVDPVVDATMNNYVSITSNITPFAEEIVKQGVASGMQFRFNLYGFDIITSNRLYGVTGADDGTTSFAGEAVYNLAMCILDDQTKPLMSAIRRYPKVEGERDIDNARDKFIARSRYGFGVQRMDTLGTIVTSATAWE